MKRAISSSDSKPALPLNSQEKRDAWPGNFHRLCAQGGRKARNCSGIRPRIFQERDEGETAQPGRSIVSSLPQIIMLYQTRRETGRLCDINREAIDTFYYKTSILT